MTVKFDREHYKKLWEECSIPADKISQVKKVVDRMKVMKSDYLKLQEITKIPWDVIAMIHEMEASCRPNVYLGNGDPLFDEHGTPIKSVHVPAGRGPFKDFIEGAIDALTASNRWKTDDWSIEHVLFMCESYNGMGYFNKGINSPYLWAGSSNYGKPPHVGRYIADGVFDSSAVSQRIGIGTCLKYLRAAAEVPTPEIKPPESTKWNPEIFCRKMDDMFVSGTMTQEKIDDMKKIWPLAKDKINELSKMV